MRDFTNGGYLVCEVCLMNGGISSLQTGVLVEDR